MSNFGVSVGDFVTVGTLAWKLYLSCKNASAEFEEVAREVSSLHTALKELEEEARKPHSLLSKAALTKQEELSDLIKNVKIVLAQLEKLLKKYTSLSTKHRRKWDIFRFGKEGVGEIRNKVTFHTSAINLFLTSLSTESLSRIEKKLDEMVLEFRRGDRDASTVANLDEDIPEAEEQWNVLKQELVDDGFTRHDIETHKGWIKVRLSALLTAEADEIVSVRSNIEMSDMHSVDQTSGNVLPLYHYDNDTNALHGAGPQPQGTVPESSAGAQPLHIGADYSSMQPVKLSQACAHCISAMVTCSGEKMKCSRCRDLKLECSYYSEGRQQGLKRTASSPPPDSRRPPLGWADDIPASATDPFPFRYSYSEPAGSNQLHRSSSVASLANSVHSDVTDYDPSGRMTRRTVTTTNTYTAENDLLASNSPDISNSGSQGYSSHMTSPPYMRSLQDVFPDQNFRQKFDLTYDDMTTRKVSMNELAWLFNRSLAMLRNLGITQRSFHSSFDIFGVHYRDRDTDTATHFPAVESEIRKMEDRVRTKLRQESAVDVSNIKRPASISPKELMLDEQDLARSGPFDLFAAPLSTTMQTSSPNLREIL